MLTRTLFAGLLLGLATGPLPGATGAAGKINALLNNSPFARAGTNPISKTADPDPIEFRAVLEESGRIYFCLFETTGRTSTWINSVEPANGLAVKAYDSAKENLLVEYQGKSLTLPLKRAANTGNSKSPIGRVIASAPTNQEMTVTETATTDEAARPPSPEEEIRARSAEAVRNQYRELALRQKLAM